MHTKLIDRSKNARTVWRSDLRARGASDASATWIVEVVAGGLLCAYSPTSAPLGRPPAGPELHYPGLAANGSDCRFSP